MTPATQSPIPAQLELHRPVGVRVTDAVISWASEREFKDGEWPGTEAMLESFERLAQAQPEEMAAWMSAYGVLRLCAHGHPIGACVIRSCRGPLEDGHAINVRDVRDAARTFDAAHRIAGRLQHRRAVPGDRADWMDLQNLLGGGVGLTMLQEPDDVADYGLQRDRLARWLEACLERVGVGFEVRWRARTGIQAEPMARDLLGVLVLLLYRSIAGGSDVFHCSHCGLPVARARRPRRGELVYCSKPECQRARVRVNQRRSRERRG